MPKHARFFCSGLALAAALLVAAATPASAQTEPTELQKLLGYLGLLEIPGEPIIYRERAPLVVPPSPVLIAPRSAEDVSKANPDWPVDHDIRYRADDPEAKRISDEQFYNPRQLRADELRPRGKAKPKQQQAGTGPMTPGEEFSSGHYVYSPRQLGFKGWGQKGEETVVFRGEPERTSLVQPPPGYLTPSPNAPYGVVTKSKSESKATSLFDRQSLPEDRAARR